MIHLLNVQSPTPTSVELSIVNDSCSLTLFVKEGNELTVFLSVNQLHEFIGTLLHLQAKMKK